MQVKLAEALLRRKELKMDNAERVVNGEYSR